MIKVFNYQDQRAPQKVDVESDAYSPGAWSC